MDPTKCQTYFGRLVGKMISYHVWSDDGPKCQCGKTRW